MTQHIEVDVRGLACPIPVVKTKKAIEEAGPGGRVTSRVNTETARDNVRRMAENAGCSVTVEESGGEYTLRIEVGAAATASTDQTALACPSCGPGVSVAAYVNKAVMGHGDPKLGAILMKAFLQTLKDVTPRPGKVIFVNDGVRLACNGSPVLPALKTLVENGIAVVSCGTCLDFYGLLDEVALGTVSNMYEIVTLLSEADRIVSP